jgi:hypothetical protein
MSQPNAKGPSRRPMEADTPPPAPPPAPAPAFLDRGKPPDVKTPFVCPVCGSTNGLIRLFIPHYAMSATLPGCNICRPYRTPVLPS